MKKIIAKTFRIRGGSIIRFPLLTLVAVLLLAGCEKTDSESHLIEIFTEPLNTGAKVIINGNNGSWVDGDKICLNGTTLSVVHQGEHTYIPCETPAAITRAVYPASLATDALSNDVATLDFPAIYHFKTDASGNQLLELPMAARSSERNPLEFKHLTGALCFVVHNTSSVPLTLQSLTVQSSGYRLNGTRSIDFNNLESLSAVTATTLALRQIRMFFDQGYELSAGEELNVMVPIPPVGSDNTFTVSLQYHTDDATTSLLYSRTQDGASADRSLLRNQLGYAGMDITNTTGGHIKETPLVEIFGTYSQIYTPHDFLLWHTAVNGKYEYVEASTPRTYWERPCKLMNDIDMTGYTFTPVMEYQSTLDGNSYTIKNLTLESCDDQTGNHDYVCGLFHNNNNNAISNLTLDNLTLKHTTNITKNLYAGALYAIANGGSNMVLSNCTVNISSINFTGTISSGALYFGGLIGHINKVASISNCHVTTPSNTIAARNIYWGGLIGYQTSKSLSITSSSWNGVGNLSSNVNTRAGGLVGSKGGSLLTVNGCHVEGAINVTAGGSYIYLAALIGKYDNLPSEPDFSTTTRIVTITLGGIDQTVVDYN